MAAFCEPNLSVEYGVNDNGFFSFKFVYKKIVVKYIFPELTIIDNMQDLLMENVVVDEDAKQVLNTVYMLSLGFVQDMTPKHKTCMLLCGIHFFIFVYEFFNQRRTTKDDSEMLLLIFFFFIDDSFAGITYNHVNWGYATYGAISKQYKDDADVSKLLDMVARKMKIFKTITHDQPSALPVSFESRKIRMLSVYNRAGLSLVDSKNGERMSPHVIDSFLYGVLVYVSQCATGDYSLFGGPISVIKEIDEFLRGPPLTVYENAFFTNIFNMFHEFCASYKMELIANTQRIRQAIGHVPRCEYVNGLLMCYLELHYFLRITRTLTPDDIYMFTEEICSCPFLAIKLPLHDWEYKHGRSLMRYMINTRSNNAMSTGVLTTSVKYDSEMFEKIKRHIISFLSMCNNDILSSDEINSCNNELQLLVLFLKETHSSHQIRVVFISLVIYFIEIYANRINNAYIYCETIYKTTEKWYKKTYLILGHKDSNFIETIEQLRNEYTVLSLEGMTNVQTNSNIHCAYENAIYVYVYIKSMMEMFLRHTPITISEIHHFRVIDLTAIQPNGGGIETQVRSFVTKVMMHSRMASLDQHKELSYTNMTLGKLMFDDFGGYVQRSKKTDVYLIDDLFTMHRDNKRFKRAIREDGVEQFLV